MAFSNLPNIYVKEAIEYERLYLLGNTRTNTGNITFVSTSSSTTYNTATSLSAESANQGEEGMLLILQSVLTAYVSIADTINKALSACDAKTTSGTGTALILAVDEFALTQGRLITFVAHASNSGAATTININSRGAKSIYRPGGTSAPTFVLGKAYTIWYDVSGGNFFFKASAEGTAVAGDVKLNVPFSSEVDTNILGTMPVNSSPTATIANNGGTVVVSAGYNPGGTITATLTNLAAGVIKDTTVVGGVTGAYDHEATNPVTATDMVAPHVGFVNGAKITGTVVEKIGSATVITPSTADQTIPAGRYGGAAGDGKVLAVANASAGNIKDGVVIAGVTGTYDGPYALGGAKGSFYTSATSVYVDTGFTTVDQFLWGAEGTTSAFAGSYSPDSFSYGSAIVYGVVGGVMEIQTAAGRNHIWVATGT